MDITLEGTIETDRLLPSGVGVPVLYEWVPAGDVPAGHRRDVRRHVDRLAARNDLGLVRVRWFRVAQDQRCYFTVDEGRIADIWAIEDADAPARDCFPGVSESPDETSIGVTSPTMPNTIGIHADLRGDLVALVVAHEIRHLVQDRGDVQHDREADAERYALTYLRDLLAA